MFAGDDRESDWEKELEIRTTTISRSPYALIHKHTTEKNVHTHTRIQTRTTNHKFNFPLWFVLSPPCCSYAAHHVQCAYICIPLLKLVIVVHSFDALVRSLSIHLCICKKVHRLSLHLHFFSVVVVFNSLFPISNVYVCVFFFVCIHFSMCTSLSHVSLFFLYYLH